MATFSTINANDPFEPDSRNKINANFALLGTATLPVAWTPTWTVGTQGLSTVSAYYAQTGKTMTFQIDITVNTGGGFSGVNLDLTLPNGASTTGGADYIGFVRYLRLGVGDGVFYVLAEGTHLYFWSNFTGTRLGANNPATASAWVTGDHIETSMTINVA